MYFELANPLCYLWKMDLDQDKRTSITFSDTNAALIDPEMRYWEETFLVILFVTEK